MMRRIWLDEDELDVGFDGRRASRAFLLPGVVIMGLGVLAIALPHVSTLAIELIVGVLFLAGGAMRLAALRRARSMPGLWWSTASALLAMLIGILFLAGPAEGAKTLTMFLIAFFVVEGIGALLLSLQLRHVIPHGPWTTVSGLVNLALAYLIWSGWPGSAAWALGLIVGLNLLFVGLALATLGMALRAVDVR